MSSKDIIVELCAGGIDDVHVAVDSGISRIELNSGMAVGGLTASAALVMEARRVFQGEIIGMVRPREGGFCYSAAEFQQMIADAVFLMTHGCDGLAVGFLNSDGSIDCNRCREFRRRFPEAAMVFHRAFDVVPDWTTALKQLVDLNFNRILTSGGKSTALDGLDQLRMCQSQADARIEILPAGGIRAQNVRQVIQRSGCRQIHTSARVIHTDSTIPAASEIHFGGDPRQPSGNYGAASRESLQALLQEVGRYRADHAAVDDDTQRSH